MSTIHKISSLLRKIAVHILGSKFWISPRREIFPVHHDHGRDGFLLLQRFYPNSGITMPERWDNEDEDPWGPVYQFLIKAGWVRVVQHTSIELRGIDRVTKPSLEEYLLQSNFPPDTQLMVDINPTGGWHSGRSTRIYVEDVFNNDF